jgi:peptidoglycan/LPS O-acetylase OafA/YrhL
MVIWFHCVASAPGIYFRFSMGVQLFFLISGFLITTLLIREKQQNGRVAMRDFYVRRTLRIFPAYYAVLGIYIILALGMRPRIAGLSYDRDTFLQNLPYFATYTSNWFVGRGQTFSHAWSLATEEQFYLFWPWVVGRSRRWFVPAVVATLLILANQITIRLLGAGLLQWENVLVRLCACLSTAILLGCSLAIFLHHPGAFPVIYRFLGHNCSAPASFLMLGLSLFLPGVPTMVVILLMTCLVGSCCIRDDHCLYPFLANPLIRYVGTISYGMYLIHRLAIRVTQTVVSEHHERPLLVFLAALVLTVVAAGISYRFYEQPFLRLKNRFRLEPLSEARAALEAVPAIRAT